MLQAGGVRACHTRGRPAVIRGLAGFAAHPSEWTTGRALSDEGRAAARNGNHPNDDPNTADPTTVIGGGSIVIHN